MDPSHPWLETARQITGATQIIPGEQVQSLWSGYGEIVRATIDGTPAIIKHVNPPTDTNHPRGWSTDRSHSRKLRSYEVELAWYNNWSQRCPDTCRVPKPIATTTLGETGWLFVLEDLDAAGFPLRHHRLDHSGVQLCLSWLANFHASFLGETPTGLWQTGTYWHLATRPDELAAMSDSDLKKAAQKIDHILSTCRFQTFVHGDAKVANFCFAPDNTTVAAVDFQYVGGGPGIKDVAYFLGSCLDEQQCQRHETEYLNHYFTALKKALPLKHPNIDAQAVESEWRHLYPAAWTDFHRFLSGWCPNHPKLTPYSERQTSITLSSLIPK